MYMWLLELMASSYVLQSMVPPLMVSVPLLSMPSLPSCWPEHVTWMLPPLICMSPTGSPVLLSVALMPTLMPLGDVV